MVDDRTRVLHLIKGLGRGGAEVLLEEGFAHADHERYRYACGYFLPHKDALADGIRSLGVPVVCFQAMTRPGILMAIGRVIEHVRSERVDLVHAHLPLAGVAARVAGWRTGLPVVYTEHNLQERYHPLTRRANRATWRLQDHVVAVSQDVADSARRSGGSGVPIQVVRNGIDPARFDPEKHTGREVRRRHGIGPDQPIVGAVAVFRTQKRLDLWLETARRIHARRPDTRFLLVGDGPCRAEVEARRRRLGLESVVVLAGSHPDVRPYLAAMDVYLVSSDFEGLPVAVLEAMAMEIVVVSTAVGGVPEAVRDGSEGGLADRGDVAGLAAAVERFLSSVEARRVAGARARDRVKACFSVERMTRHWETIYERVLEGR